MSLNTAIQDLIVREKRAQEAGAIIYSGIESEHTARSMSNFPTSSMEAEVGAEGPDGKMSPVRRTFCLIVTFDVIFTFVFWIIYAQVLNDTNDIWTPYEEEVVNYDIHYSMFDIVMSAAARFILLILAYALFRIHHWWMVAVTTFLTCAFLLSKCLIFKFNNSGTKDSNPLSYALLLVSFVLCWIETWFLDFKVLPQEKRFYIRTVTPAITERTPLLRGTDVENPETNADEFHSPIDSPVGSDDEQEEGRFNNHMGLKGDSKSEIEWAIIKQVKDTYDLVFSWYGSEKDWKIELGTNPVEGCVCGKKSSGGCKIFLLQGHININAQELWEELVFKGTEVPKWNPTVLESRSLHVLTDNIDISYYIAAPGAKGLVKSRDFVVVRKWGKRKGVYLSVGISITFPGMPPVTEYIRGENGPGGFLTEALPGEPNRCQFTWYCNTNLKGMVPQKLVDRAMGGMLLDYLKYLRLHVEQINKRRER